MRAAFDTLAAEVSVATGRTSQPLALAEGFVRIAVAHMAGAIREITLRRGHDVSRFTLACFGGAGGQHACMVADALGMTRIFIIRWRASSLPTAWGWLISPSFGPRRWSVNSTPGAPRDRRAARRLEEAARAELADQGASAEDVAVSVTPSCGCRVPMRRCRWR